MSTPIRDFERKKRINYDISVIVITQLLISYRISSRYDRNEL